MATLWAVWQAGGAKEATAVWTRAWRGYGQMGQSAKCRLCPSPSCLTASSCLTVPRAFPKGAASYLSCAAGTNLHYNSLEQALVGACVWSSLSHLARFVCRWRRSRLVSNNISRSFPLRTRGSLGEGNTLITHVWAVLFSGSLLCSQGAVPSTSQIND